MWGNVRHSSSWCASVNNLHVSSLFGKSRGRDGYMYVDIYIYTYSEIKQIHNSLSIYIYIHTHTYTNTYTYKSKARLGVPALKRK